MGTIFEITAYGDDREALAAAIEKAFAAIRRADEVLSHFKEDSDLMRLNRLGAQQPVTVPADLYVVLQESLRFSEISGGAFDVTVGPLVRLWDEVAAKDRLPTEDELARVLTRLGKEQVVLLPGRRVQLARTGVELNLGAIGKGWAVDRAVEVLRAHGVTNAYISAGTSTLYALSDASNPNGWAVEMVNPCGPESGTQTLQLRNASLSTSASYERFWEIQGRRYSHILDPRTGWPVTAKDTPASISVMAPTATESDALSTAVYVLGLEEGRRLLERLGRAGLLVEREVDGTCVAHAVNGANGTRIANSTGRMNHGQ